MCIRDRYLVKYLKTYRLYEEFDTIPDNFIRLDSIGHVLDPETGLMYAMWKKGGYDHENPYDLNYDNSIDGTISDEEMETINKYWLSCESLIKDKINWSLIETAKELSLDYLDSGHRLCIYVFADDILCYSLAFSHQVNTERWPKYFTNKLNIIKNHKQLEYMVRIDRGGGILDSDKSWELHSQLELHHPDEVISCISPKK